jgi:mRNA interferase RelE/StbE
MRFRVTEHFAKGYKKLPADIQAQVDKQISLLLENPKHPSLRIKKMQGTRGEIFEGRISKNYRFTFQIEKDTYILRKVGPHNQALKKP